jgi:NhaP-type Na+/H+ and K+/H+ antiporter
METYLCFLGVEYGLINIVTVIIFFIWAIIYFIRSRTVDKKIGTLALAMTIAFIIYLATAFMGDSWLYAMPVLGFLVGIIEYKKRNNVATVTK